MRRLWSRVTRNPMLVLLIFVTAVFGLLAYRSERADDRQDHAFALIQENQKAIQAQADDRQKRIEDRQIIDRDACLKTQTAFDALRGVIDTGLKQAKVTPAPDAASQALLDQQIKTLTDLHNKIQPITCPPAPAATP